MQSDDEVIVNRCLEGDQAAFAFLVNKYKEAVHAYAYHKVLDYQEAQDIVQEVFIKAYKKLAQLKWPHRFQSWLYTIASNECKMWLRSRSKEQEHEVPLEDVPAENLDALAVRAHSDEDIKLTVKSAMETLPDDSQLALSLYYMSGLSTREVASFMGISPNNAGVKLHRARKQLGERLEKMIGRQLKKEKLKSGFTFTIMNSIRSMPIPSLPKPRPIRWAPIPISIGMALLIGIIGYGVSSGRDVSPDMPILKPAEAIFEVSLLPDTDGQAVSDMGILDMGSEDIYQSDLASADADTTTQTQTAAGAASSGVVVRQIGDNTPQVHMSRVSPDGRYLSYINWNSGNLAIHDFGTGENRDVTDEGNWGKDWQYADISTWSPDSKQIAYLWWSTRDYSLRIVDIDGSRPRVLCSNPPESGYLFPQSWSRDGRHILALRCKEKNYDIVLVSVEDGSVRVLKSLGSSHTHRMSVSPDSRYIVYDFPQSEDSPNSDIFLLATDGSRETALVEHPANDFSPFWAPDGNGIVFASDRSGSMGIWVLEVVDGKPKGSPRLISDILKGMVPLGVTQDGSYYYGFLPGDCDVYIAALDPETGEVAMPPAKAVQSFEGFNTQPAFSPDGKYLAYMSRRSGSGPGRFGRSVALVIRSLETGEERILSPELNTMGRFPCWSPDGRSILSFTGGPDAAERELPGFYQIDIETSTATPVVLSDEQGSIFAQTPPVWSLDGRKIFFIRLAGGMKVIRAYDLETKREWEPDFRPACGEGYGSGLALSPDGQQLAFMASYDNEWSLQIAPSSGGDTREVLRLRKEEIAWGRGLTWTPDGRYLLFLGKLDEATGLCELWRIPVEVGEPQNLGLTMRGYAHLSFHPDGRRIAFTGPGPRPGHEVWAIENFLPESTASR